MSPVTAAGRLPRAAVILGLVALSFTSGCRVQPPDVRVAVTHEHPELWNPTDIVRFRGKYVAAELYRNRLAIFDDLSFSGLKHFDPQTVGRQFAAPHYLSVTPRDTLLISNGWGNSIVEIADLDGGSWKEFSGNDKKFDAPHGVCADKNGWIYVGDSRNARLVRFRDMGGQDFQEFAHVEKKIGYIRQLACADDAVWVANSYEDNSGRGGNILRISDFASGRVQAFAETPDTNTTAVLPLPAGVLWAEWSGGMRLRFANWDARRPQPLSPATNLGVPYAFFHEPRERRVLVAHFGSLDGHSQRGGILELRY